MPQQGTFPQPSALMDPFSSLSIVSEPRLAQSVEAWNLDKAEPEFAFTSMLWEQDNDFYYYRREEQSSLSPDAERQIFQKATLIPRDYYLGKLPPSGALATRAASTALSDPNVYFKKIEPYMYEPGRTQPYTPADSLTHEMQVYEELSQKFHPNVCGYLGYVPTPDGNHLLGLCVERHRMHLFRAVQDGVVFDATAVIDGVRQGLEHLHSLGYVHVRRSLTRLSSIHLFGQRRTI